MKRLSTFWLLLAGVWGSEISTVEAHGPQMQITSDGGKLTTREVKLDEPYSDTLSAAKSVYVMPVLDRDGVWYSRPNTAVDSLTQAPLFTSGPGFAYGYDMADGGPQAFAAGSILSMQFTAGLKKWDGSQFVDAGATQLKAFRGSDPTIATPDANFAVTTDSGPFDSLSLAPVAENYTEDAHASVRFALLGDGSSPTSVSADGVYLLSMQLSSSQTDLAASDPYHFVLGKGADSPTLVAAVNSLGFAADRVQYVPEPGTMSLFVLGGLALLSPLRRHT